MPGSSWKISDYITAVATSATAVFAWLAYRYALRSADPIIECDEPQWGNNKQFILWVTVRNRSAVAYEISTVEIRKPKGSTISLPESKISPAQTLDLSWRKLRPIGTVSHVPSEHPLDVAALGLVIEPPASFVSGKLRIILAISDKSIRPRQRRFVVRKFIHAAKAMMTADTVNKTD